MKKIEYKLPPMNHQRQALAKAWPHESFALFMEMGTGKTFTAINLAAGRYVNDQIDSLLVFCPTPVKLVWEHEMGKFYPYDYEIMVLESGAKEAVVNKFIDYKPGKLKVFVVGIEAMSQGKAKEYAYQFAKRNNTMAVVDESSLIKNHKADRTKSIIRCGNVSLYRLILTGTPITQGIEDLYSQFEFLNPWIIGLKSYFLFKAMYCITGGFENRSIVGYQNTEKLFRQVAPYTFIAKTEECIDMPEKSYRVLYVEPTKEQQQALKSLKDLFEAEVDGDVLTASTVLERLTRYQQICGGNFPFAVYDDDLNRSFDTKPIPGGNPKMDAILSDIEINLPHDKKCVIWARFIPEVQSIVAALEKRFGVGSAVEFSGRVDYDGRKSAVDRFQNDPKCRFFVSNQATGGKGITLTAGSHTYYYSNDFSYENRVQSEARTWRNGQRNHCTYTDVVMRVRWDTMIAAAIKAKSNVAAMVENEIRHRSQSPVDSAPSL